MSDLNEVKIYLDDLLSKSDLSSTTSEGTISSDLPDGYYLCEVEKAELTSTKATGNPMVKFQYKIVENGLKSVVDAQGNDTLVEAKNTANRKIFLNYVISTEQNLGFFVSDMLKFESPDNPGEPLLTKEYFKNTSLLLDALDILATGSRIYIMVQSKPKKDNPNEVEKRYNPITWKRATLLELPM